ncbi:MAG: RNA methyltransferase [Bacteroidota bacterium]
MRKLSLKELNRLSVNEFKATEKTPITLVLDNIRSGLNVGSAFRTADAFALYQIFLCGITATPPHREILKTAIGASEAVDWEHFEQTESALEALKAQNYQIFVVEQTDVSVPLQAVEADPNRPIALVFGNEVKGVQEQLLPMADACVEIPQFGTKHSLNISVCLGVVVWEFVKQLKF